MPNDYNIQSDPGINIINFISNCLGRVVQLVTPKAETASFMSHADTHHKQFKRK
jgi:hypothetical protein